MVLLSLNLKAFVSFTFVSSAKPRRIMKRAGIQLAVPASREPHFLDIERSANNTL